MYLMFINISLIDVAQRRRSGDRRGYRGDRDRGHRGGRNDYRGGGRRGYDRDRYDDRRRRYVISLNAISRLYFMN